MSLVLNESLVLAKTRSQDLKSVLKLNCWGSGIKDVSLVRQLVNVEVIGLSCNEITTLEDFAHCTKLKELILRKNKIKNIAEIAHLQGLPKLTSLWLDENPCVQNTHNYRKVVLKALPNLTVLDNTPVTREELQEIEELGNEIYEEIPYESSNSSNSGPSSTANASVSGLQRQPQQQQQDSYESNNEFSSNNQDTNPQSYPASSAYTGASSNDHCLNESQNYNQQSNDISYDPSVTATSMNQLQLNESIFNTAMLGKTPRTSISNNHQRCLSSQGSTIALNGYQNQGFNEVLIDDHITMSESDTTPIDRSETNKTNCESKKNTHDFNHDAKDVSKPTESSSIAEDSNYWRSRYEGLLNDYNNLQSLNQNLEEKLLNVAELFEKKKEELVANIEYEKSTLMADVDKLSTKLVDARIKLHDYEEKELIHAAECDSPCHKNYPDQANSSNRTNGLLNEQPYDPNLV